jgi:haloalkane dehalogenase
MNAYRGPFPTPESRRPTHVFPREILASSTFLAEVADRLPALSERPALIVWPTKDVAFRTPERERWEALFSNHRTVMLECAGHQVQEDAGEEIVNAIRDWRPAL